MGDDLVELILRDRITRIDRSARYVTTALGRRICYDALVLATGSYAFVTPVPGHDLPGCHVYRTWTTSTPSAPMPRVLRRRTPGPES